LIRSHWRPLTDEIREGNLGSLIALKKGKHGPEPHPKLMLAAHMDEIGLRVTGYEKGFLRVTRVGGTDRRVLLGQEVVVHGKRDLPGILASRPPHVLPPEARKKTIPWDKVFVDVGLPPAEVERAVDVGDVVSFRRRMLELKNGRVAGKAFDDRACVAAITLALELLQGVHHTWDVYAVATVQEEIGIKGATTAAFGVSPDLAVALDVTFAKHPGVTDPDTYPIGGGPTIGVGPNFHPDLAARLQEVAKTHEIPFLIDPVPGASGTDAWAIQVTREGIPTALVSIPLRYMHQPVELLDTQDIQRASRLLALFISGLEPEYLRQWGWHTSGSE
jgi:putative aminopeptidase FrvX